MTSNAKALTLRELYFRQIGNYFGVYKKILFGSSGEREKTSHSHNRKRRRCSNACKNNFRNCDSNVAADQINLSKQASMRKVSSLPGTHYIPAFVSKDETQKDNTMRQNRVSYDSILSDKDDVETSYAYKSSAKQNSNKVLNERLRHSSSKSKHIGSRLSLIFGMEDMITDSTSILKDSRYPSISQ